MSRKIALGILIFIGLAIAVFTTIFTRNYATLPQGAYGLFDNIDAPKTSDRILIVAPHQDDETLGTAGLIMQAVKVKAQVRVVYATDGNKRGEKIERHQEAIVAMESLGLGEQNLTFLDFPDGRLSDQSDFLRELKNNIANFRPNIIATTLPEDLHTDHATCGRAVAEIRQADSTFTPYYFLIHYHRYPRPASYQPADYLLPPIRLINADYHWLALPLEAGQVDQKNQTTGLYKSQLRIANPVLKKLMYSFVRQNEMFALPRN